MAKRRMPDWKDPGVRARLIIWLLTALVVIIAFTCSGIALSSMNWFCGSTCHEMSPDMQAYQSSTHSHSSCISCHIPAVPVSQGVFVLLGHKIKSVISELPPHFMNTFKRPLNKGSEIVYMDPSDALSNAVSQKECMICHPDVSKGKYITSPGIIMNHQAHDLKNIPCTLCHNRVAHPHLSPYLDMTSMEACFRCHTQNKGVEATIGVTPAIEEGMAKLKERGLSFQAPGDCQVCHPQGFPLKPVDHNAAGWVPKGLHGKAYVARKGGEPSNAAIGGNGSDAVFDPSLTATSQPKPCVICHPQKFCDDCHGGLVMPHPADFKQTHKQLGGLKNPACAKCHGSADFCNRCHHNNVPTAQAWLAKSGHPAVVKASGAEQCFKCHDPRYCEGCHITGKANPKYQ